jgi:hypothetical protein
LDWIEKSKKLAVQSTFNAKNPKKNIFLTENPIHSKKPTKIKKN